MKITFDESTKDTITNKYIKCFEYIHIEYGDLWYTLDEPLFESKIVHKLIIEKEIFESDIDMFYIIWLDGYNTLEVYLGEEIEIFESNPEPKFVSLDF